MRKRSGKNSDKSSRKRSRKHEKDSRKLSRRVRKSGKESRGKKSEYMTRTSKKVAIGSLKFFVAKPTGSLKKLDPKHILVMITVSTNRRSPIQVYHQVIDFFNKKFDLKEHGSNGGHGTYWSNAENVYNLSHSPLKKYIENGNTLIYTGRGFTAQLDFLPGDI